MWDSNPPASFRARDARVLMPIPHYKNYCQRTKRKPRRYLVRGRGHVSESVVWISTRSCPRYTSDCGDKLLNSIIHLDILTLLIDFVKKFFEIFLCMERTISRLITVYSITHYTF